MRLEVQPPYFDEPDYIAALAGSAADYLKAGFDHLLFSFHGLPERHLRKSDPTGRHCLAVENCCERPARPMPRVTGRSVSRPWPLLSERPACPPEKYSVAFQSRLGRDPWLRPYTDHECWPECRDGGSNG